MSPSSNIRDEDVRAEVQFRLKKKPPASKLVSIAAGAIKRAEILDDDQSGPSMRKCGSGRSQQLSIKNLGDKAVRNLKQICIGRAALGWVHTGKASTVGRTRHTMLSPYRKDPVWSALGRPFVAQKLPDPHNPVPALG